MTATPSGFSRLRGRMPPAAFLEQAGWGIDSAHRLELNEGVEAGEEQEERKKEVRPLASPLRTRDRCVCPPIYRRHGTGEMRGGRRREEPGWPSCNGNATVPRGSGLYTCLPLPLFLRPVVSAVILHFTFFPCKRDVTLRSGGPRPVAWSSCWGCVVSSLDDAVASASSDGVCALMILVHIE